MARERSSMEDLLAKGVGVAFAVGALAVGVAAAVANQERARQVRADVQTQLDELGRRVDDLSAQASRVLQEKRPEIEDTIAKSRRAVVDGLDKARSVVEQGAERAQVYVQKASQQASSAANQTTSTNTGTSTDVTQAADDFPSTPTDYSSGAETRDFNVSGNGSGNGTGSGEGSY